MTYSAPFPDLIDSTMLVAFRSCPQKFALAHCHGLTPDGTSVDLHFGGAIAAGMEVARKAYFTEGLDPRASEAAGVNAALTFWGDFIPPERHAKNWGSLMEALTGYFAQYPLDKDQVRPMNKESIEYTFAIPLSECSRPDNGDPIIYAGRFDLLGELDGMPCIVDEKTTGRSFTSSWSQGWNLRNQFLMYVWACQQHGINLDKVLIRGISVLKTKIDFTQAIVTIPPYLVDRAYQQVVHDLHRMSQAWKDAYFDYNFGDTCTSYGACTFVPVCSAANPSEWFSMYKHRKWSPLHKDPSITNQPGDTAWSDSNPSEPIKVAQL